MTWKANLDFQPTSGHSIGKKARVSLARISRCLGNLSDGDNDDGGPILVQTGTGIINEGRGDQVTEV